MEGRVYSVRGCGSGVRFAGSLVMTVTEDITFNVCDGTTSTRKPR